MNEFVLSMNGIINQMQYYGNEFIRYHIIDSIFTIIIGMIFLAITTCGLWISFKYRYTNTEKAVIEVLENLKIAVNNNKYATADIYQELIDKIKDNESKNFWGIVSFLSSMFMGVIAIISLIVGWYNYIIWREVPVGAAIQQILDKCRR